MPTVPRREAVERLTKAVGKMTPNVLLDFHNEVFPQEKVRQQPTKRRRTAMLRTILDYLEQGL